MSAKWQRSRAWDDQHLTGGLAPVKWVLRAFSSISMAVVLLLLVVVYAILASVPVGLIAKAPTYLIYGGSIVVCVAVIAGVPAFFVRLALSRWAAGGKRAARFVLCFGLFVILSAGAAFVWYRNVWPWLHFDPRSGSGLMLFRSFVEQYQAVTLRRLPGLEMSELEFYGWWPLRLVLLAFVLNLMVATFRRIEFNFKNIGVLTVHTGIVTIALGSVYYAGLKREGDTILLAGASNPDGSPSIGPPQDRFYDNTRVALYVTEGRGWEQRPLSGVPRYHDYGLEAQGPAELLSRVARLRRPAESESRPALSIPVAPTPAAIVSADVGFRIIGYAGYAEPMIDWQRAEPAPGEPPNPARVVFLNSMLPDAAGVIPDRPILAYQFLPRVPANRVSPQDQLAVEYTMGEQAGMPDGRWRDLSETVPDGTTSAIVIEVPSAQYRAVVPVSPGQVVKAGDTGYSVEVKSIEPEPPFPIITRGYENASSSVAVVRITTPEGKAFDRWVYHRFPEISQDLLDELNERGMPRRRDADPAIRIGYVDCRPLVQVYFDEAASGAVRAIVRQRGGAVRIAESISTDRFAPTPDLGKVMEFRFGDRWMHARRVSVPEPVPEQSRDRSMIGTHDMAMLGVEVTSARPGAEQFREIVWLPFTKYMGVEMAGDERAVREVTLPDGRPIRLAFGRVQHRLEGFVLQLVDFQMIAYDHRGAPRDYQSTLRVTPAGEAPFESFDHVASLNYPLTAPFMWSDTRSVVANALGKFTSGLNPNQFKFSQAGWDQRGWQQSQQQVDQGVLKRPFARFTILGVGNNPGIHIIAFGAILMAVGIPWAFYLKPYLVQREKRHIQEQIAAGTYVKPARAGPGAKELASAGASS